MKEKRILILSEAFGTGHTKAAEALKEGILLLQPHWSVEVIELGIWLRPRLSQLITGLYLKTLRYSPRLWGAFYRKVQNRTVKPNVEYILHRIFYKEVAKLIQQTQPDMIVCTHPFPSAVISRLKRIGLSIPLSTVITDYGAHGSWISSGVDRYYLPCAKVSEELVKMGVPADRLSVTGIPTHPKFWLKEDKAAIRQKLGLKEKPTLLCMGGGLGVGLSAAMMKSLCQYKDSIQILVVTGKNKNLFKEIKENPEMNHPHIHVYPFVENIDELMDASDILITKPGGVTCTEAMSKGIPMILLEPIPGQEEDNSRYIIENRLGISIDSLEDINLFLSQLSSNFSQAAKFPEPHESVYHAELAVKQLIIDVYHADSQLASVIN